MSYILKKELSSNCVMDEAVEIYKKRFASILAYNILGLFILIAGILFLSVPVSIIAILFASFLSKTKIIVLTTVFSILFLIVFFSLIICLKAGRCILIDEYLQNKNIKITVALSKGFSRFKISIGWTLLTIVLLIFIGAIFAGLVYLVYKTGFAFQINSIANGDIAPTREIITSIFIAMLFLITMMIIRTKLFYWFFISIIENKSLLKVFKKNNIFLKNENIKTFFRSLSTYIIPKLACNSFEYLIYFILGLILMLFGKNALDIFEQDTIFTTLINMLIISSAGIVQLLITPYKSILEMSYYINQKYKKENLEIEEKLFELQSKVIKLEKE